MSTIISSVGNTEPSEIIGKKKRSIYAINNEGKFEALPNSSNEEYLPSMVSEYYKHSHQVDLHNQLRQGVLNIERKWSTKRWYMRIFSTILGIHLVDAYYAYSYETKNYPGIINFVKDLSLSLCPIRPIVPETRADTVVLPNSPSLLTSVKEHAYLF